MGVVVQLGRSQCPRIEGDRAKLTIRTGDGEDSGNHVIRSISFDSDLCAWLEVSKDGSCSKGLLQSIERLSALVSEVPRGIFPSKPSQRNHNIRVIEYELVVEVREAQEGLYVLYLWGSGQSQIALTLLADIVRPLGERKYLRYSTESEWNSHFSGFANSLCWRNHRSTSRMCFL